MTLTWKNIPPSQFGSSGEWGYLGKIRVAQAGWNNGRSKGDGDETMYAGRIELPGLKPDFVKVVGPTLDEVKSALDDKVLKWCKYAGLEPETQKDEEGK